MKTLNKDQALYCAKIFNDYFGQFNRIDEYMRDQKMSQLNDTISASLPGMGPETEIFDNFDMSPQDMDFEITEPDNTTFDSYLNLISSHTNMSSVPGKNLKIGVCGEHAGEANSIQFFNTLQIDYISCSPFRIPTAKLAAAQAEIIKTN